MKINIEWGRLVQCFLIEGLFYVWEIFHKILSTPHNIVTDLKNGMVLKIRLLYI
jgi:hypothetical protein